MSKSSQLVPEKRGLKHASDAFAVLAIIALVVGLITGSPVVYAVAGGLFLGAVLLVVIKRKRAQARRAKA